MPTTATPRTPDDADRTPVDPGAAAPWDPARVGSVLVNRRRGWSRRARLPERVRGADPRREVVGWCDARSPEHGWLLVPSGGGVVGLALRAAGRRGAESEAQCELCGTTRPAGHVTVFAAARPAGDGEVAVRACRDLACAEHVRLLRATPTLRPRAGTSIAERERALHERCAALVGAVLAGA
ncbi:FBP domain-containing protein [Kineococcus sp. SYSU DK005]|uniref:FBP domain-containing protein n=1 Tax=Kineococcus sp. SYSU DK005 TaxID=3383126 RepID=UPI003D7E76CD